jgi:hypothetical protein
VTDVVEFDGSVWVVRDHARFVGGPDAPPTFHITAALWRIASENRVMDRLELGSTYTRGAPNPIICDAEVAEGGFWVSRVYERRLALVAPDNGTVLKQVGIGAFELPWEFTLADGDLWVGDLNRSEIVRIDPETRERELSTLGERLPSSAVDSDRCGSPYMGSHLTAASSSAWTETQLRPVARSSRPTLLPRGDPRAVEEDRRSDRDDAACRGC